MFLVFLNVFLELNSNEDMHSNKLDVWLYLCDEMCVNCKI